MIDVTNRADIAVRLVTLELFLRHGRPIILDDRDRNSKFVTLRTGARAPEAMERVMGIEPTRPAWKAGVLPLNYTRIQFAGAFGGGSWIRTNVGVRQRVYSPSPLATRASLPNSRRSRRIAATRRQGSDRYCGAPALSTRDTTNGGAASRAYGDGFRNFGHGETHKITPA